METEKKAPERNSHDDRMLENLKQEKDKFLLALEHFEFHIHEYLKHCRNVINLAYGNHPNDFSGNMYVDKYSRGDHEDAFLPSKSKKRYDLWEQCLHRVGCDMTYILIHARLFGNQTQSMCTIKSVSNQTDNLFLKVEMQSTDMFSVRNTNYEFLKNIKDLIVSLGYRHDEVKYMVLNANMTYLTLLILRLAVQDETEFSKCFTHGNTHEDYRHLCPHSLGQEIPKMNHFFITRILSRTGVLQMPLLAGVHAYLNVQEELSKTILQATCIKYIEWYQMELPMLFTKVVHLYGLETGRLWDLLSFKRTAESLTRLAGVYCNIHRKDLAKPDSNDYIWLPFKVAVEGKDSYYNQLTASDHVYLCTILACIVDTKLDMKKSFIRKSVWAKDRTAMNTGLKIAKAFQKFYAQNRE